MRQESHEMSDCCLQSVDYDGCRDYAVNMQSTIRLNLYLENKFTSDTFSHLKMSVNILYVTYFCQNLLDSELVDLLLVTCTLAALKQQFIKLTVRMNHCYNTPIFSFFYHTEEETENSVQKPPKKMKFIIFDCWFDYYVLAVGRV